MAQFFTAFDTFLTKNAQGQWIPSPLSGNQYAYDRVGQRVTNAIADNNGARTEQYGYDELNRLKTVDYGDGQTQSYAFDAMGNRLSKSDGAAASTARKDTPTTPRICSLSRAATPT